MTDIDAPDLAFQDFMTKDGAEELRRRIAHVWALKDGPGVTVRVETDGKHRDGSTLHVVRSNLVRGLPPATTSLGGGQHENHLRHAGGRIQRTPA